LSRDISTAKQYALAYAKCNTGQAGPTGGSRHDRGDVLALGLQRLDLLVAVPGPHHAGPALGVRGGRLLGGLLRIGCPLRGRRLEGGVVFLDAAVVSGDGLLHVFAQVIPHVPPVSHLLGIGCALPASQRVGTGPVPADDLDAGMGAQPVGEGGGLSVGQHVDDAVIVHVHQDAGVRLATFLGPVVDPEHGDLPDLGIGHRFDQPDQREP
jgi:hypothetical protein